MDTLSLRTIPIDHAFALLYLADGSYRHVDYQPGNGTRYRFIVVTLAEGLHWKDGPSYLVVDLNSGRSCVLAADGLLHFRYVEEKLKLDSLSDAVVVAELLGHLTGRPVVSCEEYAAEAAQSL